MIVQRLRAKGICATIEKRRFEDVEAGQFARELTRSPD